MKRKSFLSGKRGQVLAVCCTVGLLTACLGGGSNESAEPTKPAEVVAGTVIKVTAAQMNDSDLNTILFQAKSGSTISLPAGKYKFNGPLTLNTPGLQAITIEGQGKGTSPTTDTILTFKDAATKNGLQVFGVEGITLKKFAVEDAVGNGVFVQDSKKVTIDTMRAEWTTDPLNTSLMTYGLYPVKCQGVIVKNSTVAGTDDAGVYVGQSTDIRVYGNDVYLNVAGIEIENSLNAIVEDNYVHGNTGGVLVFSLPGAYEIKKNSNTIVRNNKIINNNAPLSKFASGYVAAVPPGTGVMVLAADNTEIYGNTIEGSNTTAILAISFQASGFPANDKAYNPYVRGLYAHDNIITKTGAKPGSVFGPGGQLRPIVDGLFAQLKANGAPQLMPAGLWDGILDPKASTGLKLIPAIEQALGKDFAGTGVAGTATAGNEICIKGNTLDTVTLPGALSYETIDLNLVGLLAGQAFASGQFPNLANIPASDLNLAFPFAPRMNCTLPPLVMPPMPSFEVKLTNGSTTTAPGASGATVQAFDRANAPSKLSAWKFHTSDAKTLTSTAGVVPYDLNSALFSDYSHKFRAIYVPSGKKIAYDPDRVLDLPVGSVIMKTFYYPKATATDKAYTGAQQISQTTQGESVDLTKNFLIETRVLVRQTDGTWLALPYVWDANQLDATLTIGGGEKPIELLTASGKSTKIQYSVPNAATCIQCHGVETSTGKQTQPIGPTARSLNKNYTYTSGTANQLDRLTSLNMLSGLGSSANAPKAADWSDSTQTLGDRAKAYLDINCAHCHSAVGSANQSGLLLDYATIGVLSKAGSWGVCKKPLAYGGPGGNYVVDIVPGKPQDSLLLFRMAQVATKDVMPLVGRHVNHDEANTVIADWITGLSPSLPSVCN